MRGRSVIASVTVVAFTTLIVWPRGADADEPKAAPSATAPAAAAPAPSSDDAAMAGAKQHFETGRNAYNAGDYVTAIREFKAAEQLRPSPILDYNIGLANEKLGKRRVAVKYYKRYLEIQPNAPNKAEVEQKVTTLEAEIAAQPVNTQPGGTAPQPNQVEQPSDMPPPDNGGQPGVAQAQPGYDPYSSTAPPGQPPLKPKKKRSLWWIGLIIGGVVTITVVVVVVAVYYASTPVYYYETTPRALTAMPPPSGNSRVDTHDIGGLTLRF
ncbi:MAG: hypothetical protein JWM53_5385 [bacterium]|nr:hypothetical protein [bacterium]